jgi:hypothetical protein
VRSKLFSDHTPIRVVRRVVEPQIHQLDPAHRQGRVDRHGLGDDPAEPGGLGPLLRCRTVRAGVAVQTAVPHQVTGLPFGGEQQLRADIQLVGAVGLALNGIHVVHHTAVEPPVVGVRRRDQGHRRRSHTG